jgi:lipid-A-disaccharide synthase
MKYFLIAGEASGDMHGARLMAEVKEYDQKADFMYFGGDLMKEQGGTLLKHYREMAYMGILPVLTHLGAIKRNLTLCKKQLLMFNPDVVILIDYPGFNLRIAKFAKKKKYATAYYISPNIWHGKPAGSSR